MAKKIKIEPRKKYHYQSTSGDTRIRLTMDLSRFEDNYQKAQYAMDSMVMASMTPYMPHQTGTFINVTKAMSAAIAGSGQVVAAAPPMGRYLYEGKKMVDEKTGRGPFNVAEDGEVPVWRFRKGAKLEATNEPINYNKDHNPKVTDHWFDTAKQNHGASWIRVAKKIAGGG